MVDPGAGDLPFTNALTFTYLSFKPFVLVTTVKALKTA